VFFILYIGQLTDITQAVLDAGLPQIVGITPTLILVQVALRRTAQDVEAHSTSPNAMGTRQMMSSKINFRVGPTSFFARHTVFRAGIAALFDGI